MVGSSKNGFMAIILKIDSGASNPRGVQHAHKCLEVAQHMASEWLYRFEVIHSEYHTFIMAHEVRYGSHVDSMSLEARAKFKEITRE